MHTSFCQNDNTAPNVECMHITEFMISRKIASPTSKSKILGSGRYA